MDAVRTSIAKIDDIDEMHEFMLNYFRLEASLSVAMGLTREQSDQGFRVFRNRIVGLNLAAVVEHGKVESYLNETRYKCSQEYTPGQSSTKWKLIPSDASKLLYVEVISVDERYRGRRLAQMFAKIGYIVLREIRLDEFLGNDGKPVFVCPDGTSTAQLVFKRF
ncbi:hypothetical protein PENTCL1PPCAC_13660 [Pristionchus entomophagus]|uniref:N-acetyltransferase domain-containing protein n=1 Tax=Pristionchus entomophagus TaxID=358040 RepID=A0AAV5TF23_9BILA|nr:hypothetical protein PENTCL1PPCAC_13660 [Pristionchus entomophagus]